MRTSWIITFAAICGVGAFFYTLAVGSPYGRRNSGGAIGGRGVEGGGGGGFRGINAVRAPVAQVPDDIEACEALIRATGQPTREVRSGEVHFSLARLYEEAERPDDARAAWDEAAKRRLASAQRRRDPLDIAHAWFQAGWSLWKLQRLDESRQALTEAERLYADLPTDERDEVTWRQLGWARKLLGQEVEAAIAWSRARDIVAQSPLTNQNSQYNFACYLALLGDRESALNALERAIAAGWSNTARTRHDEDLESLQELPRFQSLIEKMAQAPKGIRFGPE